MGRSWLGFDHQGVGRVFSATSAGPQRPFPFSILCSALPTVRRGRAAASPPESEARTFPTRTRMDISLDTIATKKPHLVDVRADQTVAHALNALHANNILACPVWGQPGGWVGAGHSNVIIQEKQ